MAWMKRNWLGLALAIAAFSAPWIINLRAQTTAGLPSQETFTGLHTACTLSPVTTPQSASICKAGDGVWLSINGGAYVQLGAAAPAGVTSIAVCNLASPPVCGGPLTGAVTLSIPKTVTVAAPGAALQ